MDFLSVIEIFDMFILSLKSQRRLSFTEFVKWILPFWPNIHTLKLDFIDQPKDLHNEIARLKTLKDLLIETRHGIDLNMVTWGAIRTKTTLLTSPRRLSGTADRWRFFGWTLVVSFYETWLTLDIMKILQRFICVG
jgi:hypothetical protein